MNSLVRFICSSAFVLSSMSTSAASLQVAPISLQFSTTENAKEIWLTNTSDNPIHAQTRVQEWTQSQGKDVLVPTKNIVASPMVTEIPAGGKQLIRVIKISPLPNMQEQTYRLIIDELPSAKNNDQSGLQLLLQYSVPVFFQSKNDIASKNGQTSLSQVEFVFQNQQLTVNNHGNSHIRISQLNYINPNGDKIPVVKGLLGYALANQSMSFDIPKLKEMLANGQFEARINMDGQPQILKMK